MNPSINLKEGKTIIPNQMCEGENGEYLYIVNKVGTIDQNEDNNEYNNVNNNVNNNNVGENKTPIKNNNNSKALKISITYYSTALITALLCCL